MKYILLLCCIMLPSAAYPQNVKNGKWWIKKSDMEKLEFVSGYLHAAVTFHKYYSQRKLMEANTTADSLIADILQKYDKRALGILSNISNDINVRELNSIYSNARNHLIEFRYALVIVKMKLENELNKDIEDKLLEFRNKSR